MAKEIGILFMGEMIRAIVFGKKTVTRRIVNGPVNDDPDMWHCYAVEKDPLLHISNVSEKTRVFPGTYAEFEFSGPGQHYCNVKSRWEVGDVLYARETWAETAAASGTPIVVFRADNRAFYVGPGNALLADCFEQWSLDNYPANGKWKSPLHIFKNSCRIFSNITEVTCSRVASITDVQAIDEGVLALDHKFIEKEFPDYVAKRSQSLSSLHRPPLGPSPSDRFRALWNSINNVPSPELDDEGRVFKYITYPFDEESNLWGDTYRGLPLHVVVNPWVFAIRYNVTSLTGRPK